MATSNEGVVRLPGEGEQLAVPGFEATIKVTGEETGGRLAFMETTIPAGSGGPPPHFHKSMDQAFYILSGELTLRVDARTVTATPGAYVFIPRGVVHTFANPGAVPARFVDMVYPAGFERYYRDLSAAFAAAGGMPSRETFTALFAKYDTELAT